MSQQSPTWYCTQCEWFNTRQPYLCPICGGTSFFEAPSGPAQGRTTALVNSSTYSLSTLFLVITLISVCLGVVVAAPGLGVPLIILSVPALFRTAAWKRTRVDGQSTTGQRIAAFVGSLGLVFLIIVAGIIAFQIACWASCVAAITIGGQNQSVFIVGLVISALIGLFVSARLFRKTWPQ